MIYDVFIVPLTLKIIIGAVIVEDSRIPFDNVFAGTIQILKIFIIVSCKHIHEAEYLMIFGLRLLKVGAHVIICAEF